MNQIFQQYNTPREVIDYLLNGGDQKPTSCFYGWYGLLPDLYKIEADQSVLVNGLNYIDQTTRYHFPGATLGMIQEGLSVNQLFIILNQIREPIYETLPYLIREGFNFFTKDQILWRNYLDQIAEKFTPELFQSYLDHWGDPPLTQNQQSLLKMLSERGINPPQQYLINQFLNTSITDQTLLKTAKMIDNQALVYRHLIRLIPDYLRSVEIDSALIDDAQLWLDGEHSKSIEKSLNKINKVIANGSYYHNYRLHFLEGIPPLHTLPEFQKVVQFGIKIDHLQILNYLQESLYSNEISEQYGVTPQLWGRYLADYYTHCSDDELLRGLIEDCDEIELFKGVVEGESAGIASLIDQLSTINSAYPLQLVKIVLTKGQKLRNKALRETVIKAIKNDPDGINFIKSLSLSKQSKTVQALLRDIIME